MRDEPEAIYVTKWATAQGILRVEAKVDGLRQFAKFQRAAWWTTFEVGPDEWFTSLDEARINSRRRIEKAIAAAERKATKLRARLAVIDVAEPKGA